VRIGLREEGGALHTALIPVEKAALVGVLLAIAGGAACRVLARGGR